MFLTAYWRPHKASIFEERSIEIIQSQTEKKILRKLTKPQ